MGGSSCQHGHVVPDSGHHAWSASSVFVASGVIPYELGLYELGLRWFRIRHCKLALERRRARREAAQTEGLEESDEGISVDDVVLRQVENERNLHSICRSNCKVNVFA